MNRQQRRAEERKKQKHRTATYNLTKSQLDESVKVSIDTELKQAYQNGLNDGTKQAFELLLTIPLEVLKDFYWKKTYMRKAEGFIDRVFEYYDKWQGGEISMRKMREDLKNISGLEIGGEE